MPAEDTSGAPGSDVITTIPVLPPLERSPAFAARGDLSQIALTREEERVRKRMDQHGLPTNDLPTIYLMEGKRVGRCVNRRGYFVQAEQGGGRTAFKRAFRHALADRWLETIKASDPAVWNALSQSMNTQHRKSRAILTQLILCSDTPHRYLGVLGYLWSGRLPLDLRKRLKPQMIGMADHEGGAWRQETIKLMGACMQMGPKKMARKYADAADMAFRRYDIEYKKYQAMGWWDWLSGRAGRQNKRLAKAVIWVESCQAMEDKAMTIAQWYHTGLI